MQVLPECHPTVFVIFVIFGGLMSKARVFVDRMQSYHFRSFRQNPFFGGRVTEAWLAKNVFAILIFGLDTHFLNTI